MKKITLLSFLLFTIITYGQSQLLSGIVESFDGTTWQNSLGYNYEYDSNNNLKTKTVLFWNGSSWGESEKTIYTYNTNNKVIEEVEKYYSYLTDMLENDYRSVYTYNSDGNVTNIDDFEWDSTQWVNESRSTIYYSGTVITGGFSEEYIGTEWVNSFKTTISYNTDGTISEIIDEEWDTDADPDVWVLDEKTVFTYYSNKKINTATYYDWDATSWVQDNLVTYTIDGNGNRTSQTEVYTGGTEIINYSYDMTAMMSSYANPFEDYNGLQYIYQDNPYVNKITSLNSADGTFRLTYNYNNSISLSVDDEVLNNQIKLKIYPIPSSDFVTIDTSGIIKNVEVYNTLGSKVISTTNKTLNVASLSKGIYIVNILLDNGASITKKIIKE